MAEISYNDINIGGASGASDGVGFFSIKDGEEALVRIVCDAISDLNIMTIHPVIVGNSQWPNRKVNCLRDPREPLEMCPLCAAGEKVRQRAFMKLIRYNEQTGEASPVIWDCAVNPHAKTIKSFIDNYGPLSNYLFKISRSGSGLDTEYTIIPLIGSPNYNPDNYPMPVGAFDNYKVLGRAVMDKSAEDMLQYVQTGAFPEKQTQQQTSMPTSQPMDPSVPQFNSGVLAQNNQFAHTQQSQPQAPMQGNPFVAQNNAQQVPPSTPQMQRPERYV